MQERKTIRNEVLWSAAYRANASLATKALDRIKECFKIAAKQTGTVLNRNESVIFFEKSRVGGYVWPWKYDNAVFLNWSLLQENEEHYMSVTIPHEVAHIFAHAYLDSISKTERHHGNTWQRIMRNAFGLDPVRCHRMDTERAQKSIKSFTYICVCRKHQLSIIKHNKIKKGLRYTCVSCRSVLTPIDPSL